MLSPPVTLLDHRQIILRRDLTVPGIVSLLKPTAIHVLDKFVYVLVVQFAILIFEEKVFKRHSRAERWILVRITDTQPYERENARRQLEKGSQPLCDPDHAPLQHRPQAK